MRLLDQIKQERNLDEIALIIVVISFIILVFIGVPTMPSEGLKPFINAFTLAHIVFGVVLGLGRVRPYIAVSWIVLWEVVEQLCLVPLGICGPAEMLLDSVLDIVVALVAYTIVDRMRSKKGNQMLFGKKYGRF